MTPEALHMSNTCRWVTPSDVIEAARIVMGSIDLDPASEIAANNIIKAKDYYTELTDGLNPNNKWYGNVWLNPPGDKRGELPKRFWERLLKEWNAGNVKQAFFLIFSLNQLQTLQDIDAPTNYPFLIFRKRLKFINPDTMEAANQPAQGNALIYLPSLDIQISKLQLTKFKEVFYNFGAITIPELKMSNLNFNEFATECYEAAKSKGFHDRSPNQMQISAATRFLQIIVTAAKDFEAERKRDYVAEMLTVSEHGDLESRALVRTALLATELAEAAEWCLERDLSDQTEINWIDSNSPIYVTKKPEGYGSELADIAIRLGDMVGELGVNLDYEIHRKLQFNATREFKHGKTF